MNIPTNMNSFHLVISLWYLTFGVLKGNAQNHVIKFQTVFEWNYLNFTFPSSSELFKYAFEPGKFD